MPPLSPKQQSIRERELEILAAGRRALIEGGYLGLTMDRIAVEVGTSKGTVYQHFGCKEDLIAAITIENTMRRAELFEQAAGFRGRPRERMAAIGRAAELFVRLYPDHFQTEMVVTSSSIRSKVSPEIRHTLQLQEARCMAVVVGIVRDGVAQGDLELPEGLAPAQLGFGLWSIAVGAFSLIRGGIDLDSVGVADPMTTLTRSYHALLDGYGWRPLLSEWDYASTFERIRSEIFAEEFRRVERARARERRNGR
jgi:AcrR family transcriptional regulator